ncbi:hypothetical protein D3C72_129850 [compost metagenome]
MTAVVKSMWVDSASIDLVNFLPSDIELFGLWIGFRVGIKDKEGADDFRVFVCTPEWLKNSEKKTIWGRHMLIVDRYDLNLIAAELNSQVANCVGEDWLTIAHNLSKFAAWEFEDYKNLKF